MCIFSLGDSAVGGFFLACEDLGKMFDHSFPACAVLLLLFWSGD